MHNPNLMIFNCYDLIFKIFVYSQVCKTGTEKNLEKFISVDFEEKPHSDLKYFLYNIENPKEYLSGETAVLVEKGPYKLRYVACP